VLEKVSTIKGISRV